MIAVGDATWIALAAMALGFGVIALVLIAMFRNRDIKAKLGTMELVLGSVHKAVNDQPEGQPTLSRQIAIIGDQMSTLVGNVDSLTAQIANRDRLVNARLDGLDRRVDGLDERLTILSAQVLTYPGFPQPASTGELPITT